MKKPDFIGLHTMAWLSVAGLAVYLFLATLISGEALEKISASLNLGVSVAIVFSWAPAAFYAIRRRALGKNQVVIAVFTMFMVFIVVRAYSIAYGALGKPGTWPNATIIGLFGYLIFLCGALFLIAPASIDNAEISYFRQLKWAALFGLATGAIAYWAQIIGLLH